MRGAFGPAAKRSMLAAVAAAAGRRGARARGLAAGAGVSGGNAGAGRGGAEQAAKTLVGASVAVAARPEAGELGPRPLSASGDRRRVGQLGGGFAFGAASGTSDRRLASTAAASEDLGGGSEAAEAAEAAEAGEVWYATGKRKRCVARVWVRPGAGAVTVNGQPLDEYFPDLRARLDVLAPFVTTETLGRFDVASRVHGGGVQQQSQAVRHGISKALNAHNPGLRPELKAAGLLTRDARIVERKKPGKAKARKSFQWVKR